MAMTLVQFILSYMINNDDSLPDNEIIDDLTEHINREKAERIVEGWYAQNIHLITDLTEKDVKGQRLLAKLEIN